MKHEQLIDFNGKVVNKGDEVILLHKFRYAGYNNACLVKATYIGLTPYGYEFSSHNLPNTTTRIKKPQIVLA